MNFIMSLIVLRWLLSYLESQTHFVKMGQLHSPVIGLEVGVPRAQCCGLNCSPLSAAQWPMSSQTTAYSIISTLTTHSCTLACAPATLPPGCLFSLYAPLTSDSDTCRTVCSSIQTNRKSWRSERLSRCMLRHQPCPPCQSPASICRQLTR